MSLVAGALTDGNQALRLGGTATWIVQDTTSSSLAVADGAAGGAAITGWMSAPAAPAAGTQTVIGKTGSYELHMTSGSHLQFTLSNGGAGTTTIVSNATITPSNWYHVGGVYNGDYTGTPIFGNQGTGSSQFAVPYDMRMGVATGQNNLQVCKYTIPEKGQITSLVMDLQRYYDSTGPEYVAAVIYTDNDGAPDQLVAQSSPQLLSNGSRQWVTFPVAGAVYPGAVWLGFIGGAIFGSDVTSMLLGYEGSGGTRRCRNNPVSDGSQNFTGTADSSFGTTYGLADSVRLSLYANYTPTGRTGAEGKALLYINGQLDSSGTYAHGIADTANNLQHPTGFAVDLDDWAIFNKKLTAVQIARHYSSR